MRRCSTVHTSPRGWPHTQKRCVHGRQARAECVWPGILGSMKAFGGGGVCAGSRGALHPCQLRTRAPSHPQGRTHLDMLLAKLGIPLAQAQCSYLQDMQVGGFGGWGSGCESSRCNGLGGEGCLDPAPHPPKMASCRYVTPPRPPCLPLPPPAHHAAAAALPQHAARAPGSTRRGLPAARRHRAVVPAAGAFGPSVAPASPSKACGRHCHAPEEWWPHPSSGVRRWAPSRVPVSTQSACPPPPPCRMACAAASAPSTWCTRRRRCSSAARGAAAARRRRPRRGPTATTTATSSGAGYCLFCGGGRWANGTRRVGSTAAQKPEQTAHFVAPPRRAYYALSWGDDEGELRRGLELAKRVQRALVRAGGG